MVVYSLRVNEQVIFFFLYRVVQTSPARIMCGTICQQFNRYFTGIEWKNENLDRTKRKWQKCLHETGNNFQLKVKNRLSYVFNNNLCVLPTPNYLKSNEAI